MFPPHNGATADDRLFIVCDGMGGHSAGDVASSTVCAVLGSSIKEMCPDAEGTFKDEYFETALSAAYDALDRKDDGSPKKMGTTMTLVKLHDGGCTIAHIGDSRVYHIRPGADADSTEILFQTQDHSLVNDLVRIGELTPEQAKTSNQRNVITRAIQPNMGRRSRADIAHISDIRPGDYFMLCSDGILEQMEDDNLKFIFSDKGGDARSKIDMLIKVTAANHDNHTAILVHITDVVATATGVAKPAAVAGASSAKGDGAEATAKRALRDVATDGKRGESLRSKSRQYLVPTLAVCALLVVGIPLYLFLSAPVGKGGSGTAYTAGPTLGDGVQCVADNIGNTTTEDKGEVAQSMISNVLEKEKPIKATQLNTTSQNNQQENEANLREEEFYYMNAAKATCKDNVEVVVVQDQAADGNMPNSDASARGKEPEEIKPSDPCKTGENLDGSNEFGEANNECDDIIEANKDSVETVETKDSKNEYKPIGIEYYTKVESIMNEYSDWRLAKKEDIEKLIEEDIEELIKDGIFSSNPFEIDKCFWVEKVEKNKDRIQYVRIIENLKVSEPEEDKDRAVDGYLILVKDNSDTNKN